MSKTKSFLIKAGTVVLGRSVSRQDILVSGEKIAAVGDLNDDKADREIDAADLLVLPGAVDTHVHFNDYFMNTVSVHDFESGTRAAAFGGVTSIVDFANQKPGESLLDTLRSKKQEAEGNALVDWGVHPVITSLSSDVLDEIPILIQEGAPTIKCYMTYREEGLMMGYDDLTLILKRLKDSGGMLMLHAEDNDIIETNIRQMIEEGKTQSINHARSRPIEAENRAIRKCIRLAEETGGRIFIVHMSSAEGMEAVGRARAEGRDILAETCTHYLIFTEKMLERDDGIKWICSPPLRDEKNQALLWQGIRDGRISMVTSDDAAYSWEAKLLGKERFDRCPNGIPGIEPRLYLLYSEGVAKGRISLPRLVELTATVPAVLFGLAPQKGTLFPGSDADIVLFDPQKKWVMNRNSLHMAADWSAYEGMEITGKIVKVFSRGQLIIDNDECPASKGRGRYLHRNLDPNVRTYL
ncbi:MAG: dihydropyrimidinase [Candidatus Aminicenantes bacterium]|nr:dihydropyrimidinase [Candidatus Aminicenantes bacterium]